MDGVPASRRLIVTVHGIRTFGHWQERLEALVRERDGASGVHLRHYKYGYFSSVAFMLPFLRWWVTRRFRKDLAAACAAEPWTRIDVVAHSFGTHLVGWGLMGIPASQRPRIHTVLLAGSVLKPGFPWQQLTNGCVGRVINDCGTQDAILVLNQALVLFSGMAGRVGFAGMSHERFRNRYFALGHSGYFLDGARADDGFMRTWWLPVLLTEDPPALPEDPRDASALQGVVAFALNNAEPVKLALWLTPFVFLTLLFFGLYRQAESLRIEASRRLLDLQVASAERRSDVGDLATALVWNAEALATSRALADVAAERDQRVRMATGLRRHPGLLRVHFFERSFGNIAALSPDGTLLALGGVYEPPGVLDVTTGARVPLALEGAAVPRTFVFSGDSTRLAALCDDHALRIWDARTGLPVCPPLQPGGALKLSLFAPDGERIVVVHDVDSQSFASLWEVRTGRRVGTPITAPKRIQDIAFSPDGARLAAISEDGTARIGSATAGEAPTASIDCGVELLYIGARMRLAFSPTGERLVTSNGEQVHVWDTRTGARLAGPWPLEPSAHVELLDEDIALLIDASGRAQHWSVRSNDRVGPRSEPPDGTCIAVSPRADGSPGRAVILADSDGHAHAWGSLSAAPLCPPLRNLAAVGMASASADGERIAVVDEAGLVRVWDLATPDALVLEHGERFDNQVWSASFSPDGTRILTVARNLEAAYLWDARTGADLHELHHGAALECASFSPDGARVLTAGQDGMLRLWDAATGAPLGEALEHGAPVLVASFDARGERIVAGCEDGSLHLWSLAERRALLPPIAHGERAVAVGFVDNERFLLLASGVSARLYDARNGEVATAGQRQNESGLAAAAVDPGGKWIATGGMDGIAAIWDARSGEPRTPPLDHSGGPVRGSHSQRIGSCAFSPDGTLLATAGGAGTTRIWSTTTGALAAPILPDAGSRATFSPDGRWTATAGADGSVRVWDVRTGAALTPPFMHASSATCVAFDAAGQRLVSASLDGTARIWDLAPLELPPERLRMLAELLASRRIDAAGGLVDLTLAELRSRWESLHP